MAEATVSRVLPGIVLLLTVFMAAPAMAHPGIGIVRDSRGNIFYTDLRQVLKIAPDGRRTVAVPGVHTHELYIDASDNLYGEHLWYEGEATDRWNHRVWRLDASGRLTDVIPPRRGFLQDYDDFHFVRDERGHSFWVRAGKPSVLMTRPGTGRAVVMKSGPVTNPRELTSLPDGTVYVVDDAALKRIGRDGTTRTVAANLGRSLMGVWTDPAGAVYVAVWDEKVVKRISPDGRVDVVHRSEGGWAPTGGLVTPSGVLWALEYNEANDARIRQASKVLK